MRPPRLLRYRIARRRRLAGREERARRRILGLTEAYSASSLWPHRGGHVLLALRHLVVALMWCTPAASLGWIDGLDLHPPILAAAAIGALASLGLALGRLNQAAAHALAAGQVRHDWSGLEQLLKQARQRPQEANPKNG